MHHDIDQHPIFTYFKRLNHIPRCSDHEEEVSKALFAMGKELVDEVTRDQANNVIIHQKAEEGYENAPKLVIQGHMDMVCVRDEKSMHDFTKDPIDMFEEDGWLKANGTSLGADDGIGVATGLAVLSENLYPGDLTVLLTTSEETGMGGAIGVSADVLDKDMLLNIDTEIEDTIITGCAGGCNGLFRIPFSREPFSDEMRCFTITVENLRGGHSGLEILEVNTNAIKILSEFLRKVQSVSELISIDGGTKTNIIPSSAKAVVAVKTSALEDAAIQMKEAMEEIVQFYLKTEPDISIRIDEKGECPGIFSKESALHILNTIDLLPHGVNTMMEGDLLVESSNNLAIVETKEDHVAFTLSLRSSSPERMEELKEKVSSVMALSGGEGSFKEGYPAWQPKKDSALAKVYAEHFRETYGEDPKITVVHAGLECGLFSEKNPKLDMISVGPDVTGAHTVKERVRIASVITFYENLKEVLKGISRMSVEDVL